MSEVDEGENEDLAIAAGLRVGSVFYNFNIIEHSDIWAQDSFPYINKDKPNFSEESFFSEDYLDDIEDTADDNTEEAIVENFLYINVDHCS